MRACGIPFAYISWACLCFVVQVSYGEKTAENTEFLWPWSVMVHSPVSVRQILTVLSYDAVRPSAPSVLNTAERTRTWGTLHPFPDDAMFCPTTHQPLWETVSLTSWP